MLEDLGTTQEAGRLIGPARFTPVLTDLGPVTAEASAEPEPAEPEAAAGSLPNSDTTASRLARAAHAAPTTEPGPHSSSDNRLWTVSEGDHLWKIAMKILRDHGRPTEPAAVVDYWQQLIDFNSEVLNGNPDLIHPGTVLRLPEVPPRP